MRPHSLPAESHSFVGMARETAAMPPARRRREKKKKERFYIYSDVTHTPGRNRENPERQEEEKSGHTTGRRPKQRRGEGNRRTSGTNLHSETDVHTPKPHDTLRRGTRGIRDQMGD